MQTMHWRLAPDGYSLGDFQKILLDASQAMDQNRRGVFLTTVDVVVVLKYLSRLHEKLTTNTYSARIEQLNLCQIALRQHEAPDVFGQAFDEDSALYVRHWLKAKIDMIETALYQERHDAQTDTVHFLVKWHQIVSDEYLH